MVLIGRVLPPSIYNGQYLIGAVRRTADRSLMSEYLHNFTFFNAVPLTLDWFPCSSKDKPTIGVRRCDWWNGPFDPHNASRWRWKVSLLHMFEKVQATLRLPAPSFLFDSLSQYPLSNCRGYWDRLSNYLIVSCKFSPKRGKTPEQFTKCSCLVGKWCFCHYPSILTQWNSYIAKYPWPPITNCTSPNFEIGVHTDELWHET